MAITLLQRCFCKAPDSRAVKKLHVGFRCCIFDTENFQNKEWEQQKSTFSYVHFLPSVNYDKRVALSENNNKKNP